MYSEFTISNVNSIPELFADFADQLGWDVNTSNPTATRFQYESGLNFRMRSQISGAQSHLHDVIVDSPDDDVDMRCLCRSPIIAPAIATGIGTVQTPTKLHMLGGISPEPWLAGIIEYGFNSYRHIYVGYMEKIGDYSGGEVVSACHYQGRVISTTVGAYGYANEISHRYLFNFFHENFTTNDSGGVRIVHEDNPDTYRRFARFSSTLQPGAGENFDVRTVMGGFKDGINDGYLARSRSSHLGGAVMVPINLYAPRPGNNLSPIGRPAGVRMLDISDIAPGTSIEVGGLHWRVFPAFRKTSYTEGPPMHPGPPQRANIEESSFTIGYAYLEG